MAYKVQKTYAFGRDLDAVISYIALSLENKAAAVSLLDDLEKLYDALERMPLMYEACHDPYLRGCGYRRAGIRNYIVVYKVDEATNTVILMRLFHGRQDYEKLI